MATLLRLNIDYFISRAEEERKRRAMTFALISAALMIISLIFSSVATALMIAMIMLVLYNIDIFRLLLSDESQVVQDSYALRSLGDTYHNKKNYAKAKKL